MTTPATQHRIAPRHIVQWLLVMVIVLFVFPMVLGFFILHRNSVQTEQRYKAHPAAGQPVP